MKEGEENQRSVDLRVVLRLYNLQLQTFKHRSSNFGSIFDDTD